MLRPRVIDKEKRECIERNLISNNYLTLHTKSDDYIIIIQTLSMLTVQRTLETFQANLSHSAYNNT